MNLHTTTTSDIGSTSKELPSDLEAVPVLREVALGKTTTKLQLIHQATLHGELESHVPSLSTSPSVESPAPTQPSTPTCSSMYTPATTTMDTVGCVAAMAVIVDAIGVAVVTAAVPAVTVVGDTGIGLLGYSCRRATTFMNKFPSLVLVGSPSTATNTPSKLKCPLVLEASILTLVPTTATICKYNGIQAPGATVTCSCIPTAMRL